MRYFTEYICGPDDCESCWDLVSRIDVQFFLPEFYTTIVCNQIVWVLEMYSKKQFYFKQPTTFFRRNTQVVYFFNCDTTFILNDWED